MIRLELYDLDGELMYVQTLSLPLGAGYEEITGHSVPRRIGRLKIMNTGDPEPQPVELEEGRCQRCGKLVTRHDGGRWTDQYGRDRCRASWDDDQCLVPTA
jgi:hypothetical protein